MRTLVFSMAMLALSTPCLAQHDHGHDPASHAQHGGYAQMLDRDIKALSPEQIAELRAGKGMGLSLPAELNKVPGPLHALEMRDTLALTPDQVSKLEAIMARMRSDAMRLGEEIIQAERALDRGFKEHTVDLASIDAQSDRIGELNGKLRAVHLKAHLETSLLLTEQQNALYQRERGYAARPQAHG